MTQPVTRIRSEYQPHALPAHVKKWETWANNAPTDMAALIQLAYVQALQLRMIKLTLIWTLIILPILAGLALFVLSEMAPATSSRF